MLKRDLLRVFDWDVWTWVNRLAPRVFLGFLFGARFHSAPFGQDRTPVWIEPSRAAQFVKRLLTRSVSRSNALLMDRLPWLDLHLYTRLVLLT